MEQLNALVARLAQEFGLSASDLTLAFLISVPLAAVLGWIFLPRLLPRAHSLGIVVVLFSHALV